MNASTEQTESLYPDVLRIRFEDGNMVWDFADGRTAAVPMAWYPTLMLATPAERADYHICHYSAHWPQLDCDLGANAIILGHKEAAFFADRARERYAARTSATVAA